MLKIDLLGGFAVTLAGTPVTGFRSIKSRVLLAWLAVQPDVAHERTTLAGLLWGEMPDRVALTNLRVTLADLKKLLGEHPALEIERHSVRFHSAQADVDVTRFLAGLTATTTATAPADDAALADVLAALNLFRGDFLAGLSVADAPTFEDWRLITQERLHRRAMLGFDWLLHRLELRGDWPTLARVAGRQLALVPWHEPAHRALMTAYARQGQVAAARAQYERCRETLQAELGVAPAPATRALLQRLLTEATHTETAEGAPRGNLPAELTPFFGREVELSALAAAIAARRYRLLTVTGLGGSGKTRLALRAAAAQAAHFPHGVWFVPLANTYEVEAVVPAIAAALGLSFAGSAPAAEQLQRALAERDLLLLLDNLEQLPVQVADVIADLLRATRRLVIVVTSRRRLDLRIEQLFPLEGLAVADAALSPAVALFREQMQRVNPNMREIDDLATIGALCRLLGGLPLGIELAAAQTARLALPALAQSLQRGFDALHSSQRDVPAQQRSLAAAFEASWVLLDGRQQAVLAQLAVFEGGFDLPAARAVAGVRDHQPLQQLTAQSLVQQPTDRRYALHPLVQTYAAARLGAETAAHARHGQYYLELLATLTPRFLGSDLAEPLATGTRELPNIEAAWRRAVRQRVWDALQPAVAGLRALYRFRVLYREGAARFAADYAGLAAAADAAPAADAVLGRLAAAEAWFLVQLHRHADAEAAIARALHHAEAAADHALRLDAQMTQQILLTQQDDFAASLRLADELIAQAEARGLPTVAAYARDDAGYVRLLQGQFAAGRDMLAQAAATFHAVGDVLGELTALRNLGLAHMCLREMTTAESHLLTAQRLAQARHDWEREIFVVGTLATVYYQSGDYGRAVTAWQQQLAFARANGLEADVAACLGNLALAWLSLGRYAQAADDLYEAVPLMERVESSANLGACLLTLARLHQEQGAYADALAAARRVLTLARDNAIVFVEGNALALLGSIQLAAGDLAAAEAWFAEALAHRQRYGEATKALFCYSGLAQVAHARGDLAQARAWQTHVLADNGYERDPAAYRLLYPAFLVLRATEPDEAARLLALAQESLRTHAARIQDAEERRAFLEDVALHRAIMAA